MQLRRFGFFSLVAVVLILVTSVGYSVQAAKAVKTQLFVGQVTDKENEFVALAITDGAATIYICDGQADKGTISLAEWFIGTAKDSAVEVTAPSGNRVQVKFTDTAAEGQFTFKDGTIKKFSLKLALDAALYRSDFTLDEIKYVGGWLVLPDGSVRGGIRNSKTGTLTPATFQLDPINKK